LTKEEIITEYYNQYQTSLYKEVWDGDHPYPHSIHSFLMKVHYVSCKEDVSKDIVDDASSYYYINTDSQQSALAYCSQPFDKIQANIMRILYNTNLNKFHSLTMDQLIEEYERNYGENLKKLFSKNNAKQS
jgi:hypothetical protein